MYEGDIGMWGGLSAGQMTDRFWWGLSYGIYVGHGETVLTKPIHDDDQVLWWSKGDVLRVPFSSQRKRMSTLVAPPGAAKPTLLVKGASEVVLSKEDSPCIE